MYNICYINGFQVQPGEVDDWPTGLVLRNSSGEAIIDPVWKEALVDVSTATKQTDVADIVGVWIDGCAEDGFDAIEIDNLDSYLRSDGRLSQDNAVATMSLLAERAHAKGLAFGQKNSAELLGRKTEMKTDFVIAEQCSEYNECDDFVAAYGPNVIAIEYKQQAFTKGCDKFGPEIPIVLRDVAVSGPDSGSYQFETC